MDLFGTFVVFVVVWWMVFFVTLPFGVTVVEKPGHGHVPSAPDRPRLVVKASITTVIALTLTGLAFAAVEFGLIDFRGWLTAP